MTQHHTLGFPRSTTGRKHRKGRIQIYRTYLVCFGLAPTPVFKRAADRRVAINTYRFANIWYRVHNLLRFLGIITVIKQQIAVKARKKINIRSNGVAGIYR